jgi:hypothetical protein
VEALNQLLGAAAPPDCVRPPAAAAQVEGSFQLTAELCMAVDAKLLELGLPPKALAGTNQQALRVRREVRGGHACPALPGPALPCPARPGPARPGPARPARPPRPGTPASQPPRPSASTPLPAPAPSCPLTIWFPSTPPARPPPQIITLPPMPDPASSSPEGTSGIDVAGPLPLRSKCSINGVQTR